MSHHYMANREAFEPTGIPIETHGRNQIQQALKLARGREFAHARLVLKDTWQLLAAYPSASLEVLIAEGTILNQEEHFADALLVLERVEVALRDLSDTDAGRLRPSLQAQLGWTRYNLEEADEAAIKMFGKAG